MLFGRDAPRILTPTNWPGRSCARIREYGANEVRTSFLGERRLGEADCAETREQRAVRKPRFDEEAIFLRQPQQPAFHFIAKSALLILGNRKIDPDWVDLCDLYEQIVRCRQVRSLLQLREA